MNSPPFKEETEIKDWQGGKKLGRKEENLQVILSQVTQIILPSSDSLP